MISREEIFSRTERLLGKEAMDRLGAAKVILFGAGGVGSWCAEGLIRSGIGHLTIVDSDDVAATNINRQLMATTKTVGRIKVEVLRERLLEINPFAEITAVPALFREEEPGEYNLDSYDYVIDAIDSLRHKIALMIEASSRDTVFFASMGAALKVDPTRVQVAPFSKVKGCPLGYIIRKRMRQSGRWPSKDFLCVFDDEVLQNAAAGGEEGPENHGESTKAAVNGTTCPVTAIFGFTLAGLVLKDIASRGKLQGPAEENAL